MVGSLVGRFGLAALLFAVAGPALADGVCTGNLSGSVLQSLARPTIISITQPVSDNANPALAQQFLNGVQAGGVTVTQPGQGNTQLDVTFTVTPPAGATGGTFKGFSWMSGLQAPSGGGSALPGSVVSASVEATDLGSQTLAWVGTITCTIQTSDPNVLAAHLGQIVGRALGRPINRQSF